MTPLLFLIGALATYRLSLMVSKESGPGRIFRKLRNLPSPKSATREGLRCQLCTSVWFAIPVTWVYWYRGWILGQDTLLYGLALSAAAVVIHMHTTKNL